MTSGIAACAVALLLVAATAAAVTVEGYDTSLSRTERRLLANQENSTIREEEALRQLRELYGIMDAVQILYFEDGTACNNELLPMQKQELSQLCPILDITEPCKPVALGLEPVVVGNCLNSNCTTIWSEKFTACSFTAALGIFVQSGSSSQEITCGLPARTWETLNNPIQLWDIPEDGGDDGLSCALARPSGARMTRNIICIDGTPRLHFNINWGKGIEKIKPPPDVGYMCIIDDRCSTDQVFQGKTICYI